MEVFTVKDLTFTYPGRNKPALKEVSFSVQRGEMVTLCGRSGSGKTTLMKLLKPELAPHGLLEGGIHMSVDGPGGVGFVLQDPDNQIVTDKVWHELAFGPENLGWETRTIRIRVAEMASYFGIQNWFRKDVSQLSGGQKQLLNLAAVMVMKPEVLLLDEPTAQLDPIAAGEFIDTVRKLNRETGITVVLTEHRLDSVLPVSDRMIVLEDGRLIVDDEPRRGVKKLAALGSEMFKSMPAPVQAWTRIAEGECPLDVREGRMWLEEILGGRRIVKKRIHGEAAAADGGEAALRLKNVWFRYSRSGEDVLRGLDCEVSSGSCFAIMGGNGSGKTTALKIMSGAVKPYRGKVDRGSLRVLMLPQDPQLVFASDTVREELAEMSDSEDEIAEIAGFMEIDSLLDAHPYDISGGEQQRTALAKLLLAAPDVILLDEPTKGMDSAFKEKLGGLFRVLKQEGRTIIMVSHDIEFCGRYADRCAMFFDGSITTSDAPGRFFAGNSFYTTEANRMSAGFFEDAVTPEDLAALVEQNLTAADGEGSAGS
ncbi:MAG: ABC transporter ATP-binding protein [Anaerovoracaceae bacterium]|jgi:energy-coupling factor transporter ATP-binding protein EcfA2